ncbi:unnamed protein product [Ceutorhynchus assimilis]|uniref:RZ-type domain-containing protein n=1 Tax=Ceutorhynchus assimilis TaxID=467358 RepID=A0A9N9MV85_9CUCU|nr:unnamed protein product [Ceutorhynchus assimilis]
MLLKYCTEPCRTELDCKTREFPHKCSGTCGECMQGRIHKRCNEKCGVPLVCNHECPIPCRQACKPCTRPCQVKCAHSKCKKKCGEPCTPCMASCNRKCEHVRCSRVCGEICDVGPCKEKCPEVRKCGHPCVGFCGDPCPKLCRVCNREELTEIFFGTEDAEDAIFVQLKDCGDVIESSALERHLNGNENEIGYKKCPRCNTNISSTERFSHYIKQSIDDVIKAKEKSFGTASENEDMRSKLSEELSNLKEKCTYVSMACPSLKLTINTLLNRLQPVRSKRRQPINKVELNAIKSKTQTLSYIIQCFKDVQKIFKSDDASIEQLTMLLEVLLRSEDHVTHQEVNDLTMEIKRLQGIVQYDNIHKSTCFQNAITKSDILNLRDSIRNVLFNNSKYTDSLDDWIKPKLREFAFKVNPTLTIISDTERIEIVRAMELTKGHWYKCPNGHPYAIGECGGAMQTAKCFCGAQIGGTDHALLRDNALAGEMDGATRSAWPGHLYRD